MFLLLGRFFLCLIPFYLSDRFPGVPLCFGAISIRAAVLWFSSARIMHTCSCISFILLRHCYSVLFFRILFFFFLFFSLVFFFFQFRLVLLCVRTRYAGTSFAYLYEFAIILSQCCFLHIKPFISGCVPLMMSLGRKNGSM